MNVCHVNVVKVNDSEWSVSLAVERTMKMRGLAIHPQGDRPLTLFVELFGAAASASAIAEVMQTGHVGAEYVEYVLRHKRRLVPDPHPLRLGSDEFDGISLPEPDLSIYDQVMNHRAMEVTYWDFDATACTSINLFPDGTIGDSHLLTRTPGLTRKTA